MEKEDIRSINTKHKLCEALFVLIRQNDFDKISVMDICEKSEVHRATFYRHFENKQQLLNYALNLLKEEIVKKTTPYIHDVNDPKKVYLILAEKTIEYLQNHMERLNSVIKSNKSEEFFMLVREIFESSVRQLIKKNSNIKINENIVSNFFIGGFISLLRWWLTNPQKCSKEELLSALEYFLGNN